MTALPPIVTLLAGCNPPAAETLAGIPPSAAPQAEVVADFLALLEMLGTPGTTGEGQEAAPQASSPERPKGERPAVPNAEKERKPEPDCAPPLWLTIPVAQTITAPAPVAATVAVSSVTSAEERVQAATQDLPQGEARPPAVAAVETAPERSAEPVRSGVDVQPAAYTGEIAEVAEVADIVEPAHRRLEAAGKGDRPGHEEAAPDLPLRRLLDAADDLDQSGFAGAVLAEDGDLLARRDVEGNAVEHAAAPDGGVIILDDPLEFDAARRHGACSRTLRMSARNIE